MQRTIKLNGKLAALFAVMFAVQIATTVGTRAEAGISAQNVDYSGDGVSTGYMAYPENATNAPAIILIHEWWGLNDQIKGVARRFAEAGYVALAIDLYGGEVATTRDRARELAGGVSRASDVAFANLGAAVDYLKSQPRVDPDRLASTGWCFGGGWSYKMALNNLGTRASVIYYGFFNPSDDLSKMRARILGHFGEADRAIKVDNVRTFEANLATHSGDHRIFIYPNAGHSFANETGANYDRDAAEDAWQRTLEFLEKHL